MPEGIDCSDIILQSNSKLILQDQSKNFLWQNVQLKKDLREGEDFMLITPEIYEYAFKIYG